MNWSPPTDQRRKEKTGASSTRENQKLSVNPSSVLAGIPISHACSAREQICRHDAAIWKRNNNKP